MLNVRKKIVVMNVKILIDQVARYEVKEWVQRSKSKLRAQSARVLPSVNNYISIHASINFK